ncbi:MAG: PEP-CTERM sorting domain-containing protein [Limisphaerales bacterium]
MKTLKITILLAILTLGINVKADGLYDIFFTDGGANVGFGQINVQGGYAISGFFNVTAGAAIGSYSLYTAGGTGTYQNPLDSPALAFHYDNAVYLGSNPQFPVNNPFVDFSGLLFTGISNNEINLFAPADNGTYSFNAFINNLYLDPVGIVGTSSITPAPEPSSMAMVGLMLIPAAALLRRKMKSQQCFCVR